MASSVDPDQTAPIEAVCSGSTLFASILNSSLMLGNYLQQTTSLGWVINEMTLNYSYLNMLNDSILIINYYIVC